MFNKNLKLRGSLLWLLLSGLLMVLFLGACGSDDSDDNSGVDDDNDKAEDGDTDKAEDGDVDDEVVAEEEAEYIKPDPTKFMVGYAQADVSPPIGTALGGYGVPGGGRACTGVQDPLMIEIAFIANDARDAFVLMSIDSTGYFYDFGELGPGVKAIREAIAEAAGDKFDIEPTDMILGASHSHTATDLMGMWKKPSAELLNNHFDIITQTAIEAMNNMEDARLFYGQTELVGYSGRDDGCSEIIDNSVNILQFRNASDDVLLTATNYAKHPTFASSNDTDVSADYIYGYREEMKKATGAPAMFLQGFIAAVHSGELSVEGADHFERMYNFGALLADTVLAEHDNMVESDQFDIQHRAAHFSAAAEGDYITASLQYLHQPERSFEYNEETEIWWATEIEVSWHKLGNAEFVAFPGEGDPAYSLALRERIVSPYKFTVGLGNDALGYILNPESVENDLSATEDEPGRLEAYELQMGMGINMGPACWDNMESLGWFDGGYLEEQQ